MALGGPDGPELSDLFLVRLRACLLNPAAELEGGTGGGKGVLPPGFKLLLFQTPTKVECLVGGQWVEFIKCWLSFPTLQLNPFYIQEKQL